MRDSQLAALVATRPIYKIYGYVYKSGNNDWKLENPTEDSDFELLETDFAATGNVITTDGGSNFPIGNAVSRMAQLKIKNSTRYTASDFNNACIVLGYRAYAQDGTVKELSKDYFFVKTAQNVDGLISAECSDIMSKADIPFDPTLVEGLELSDVLKSAVLQSGMADIGQYPIAQDYTLWQNFPLTSGYTCRQIIAFVAMTQGWNAIARAGRATITLRPSASEFNTLAQWIRFKDEAKSISITGYKAYQYVDVNGNEIDPPIEIRAPGYSDECAITIENPLIFNLEAEILADIRVATSSKVYRNFSGSHIGYPLAEYGDQVNITHLGGSLSSYLTKIVWNISGGTEFACEIDTGTEGADNYIGGVALEGNQNPVNDVVIQQDTDEISSFIDRNGNEVTADVTRRWRKWSSGLLEQWIEREVSGETYTTALGTLGALYRSAAIPMPPYAVEFVDISNCVVGCNHDNSYIAWMIKYTQGTNTHPPDIAGVRHNNSGTLSGKLTVYAVGTWE